MRRGALVVVVLVAAAVPLSAPDGTPPRHVDHLAPAAVRVAPAVLAAAAAAAPAPVPADTGTGTPDDPPAAPAPVPTLDLVLSLERPAGPSLRRQLERLGTWSWAFRRIPVAAVRLPADRLDELAALDGVVAVQLNEALPYLLQDSARLLDAPRAWNDLGVTGEGVTVAIIDTGVDFTHPDLAPPSKPT